VISCIANSKNLTNNKLFDKIDWDLIIITPAYNNNKYTSYFRYKDTDFTKIYIYKNKINTVDYINNFARKSRPSIMPKSG
jgi:hypothetical protein